MAYKFVNILKESIIYYLKYFYINIGFGISMFFSFLLISLNFSLFSGQLSYSFTSLNLDFLFALIALIFSAVIYSFFTTILVFLVRKNLQQGYSRTYVLEVLKERYLAVLLFNFLQYLVLFLFYVIFKAINFTIILPFIYIITLLFLFFVNQSIIIEEYSFVNSIRLNYEFIKNNKFYTFLILLIMFILYFILILLTYYFSFGFIISFIIINIVFVPFLEILKTVVYMTKFKILKSYF